MHPLFLYAPPGDVFPPLASSSTQSLGFLWFFLNNPEQVILSDKEIQKILLLAYHWGNQTNSSAIVCLYFHKKTI
jgi:hypothetical protein